ncbi:MAG: enoyl-CoA hydratase/isomerase family protein [Gammaproteobacteria bacterium]|nr:enoyl-CoA hydratase/isomerase family protein [Gammaproteobacteria bacterium]
MSERVVAKDMAEGVRLLQLNRPEKLNAFDLAMRQCLQRELATAAADQSIRVVIITGGDKAFVAGADLAAVATATAQDMAAAPLHHIWDALEVFPKPLIMAVKGYCFGAGCELMMHGDIVVLARDAQVGQPEIKVGIQPGAGGLSRLVRLVGYHRAMAMVMTGASVCGETAAAWGLASECVAADEVLSRALALANTVAGMSSDRIASIRAVARQGLDLPLTEQLRIERNAYWQSFGTADQREGMAAFLEKRPARFNKKDGDSG